MADSDIKVTASPGYEFRVLCAGACGGLTFHRVLARAADSESDGYREHLQQWDIVQCLGCRTISFRYDWQIDDDLDFDAETGERSLASHEVLYPSRSLGDRPLPDAGLLPEKVGNIYMETRAALASKLPVLSGIGIRALVEAVCSERGASGNNLEKQIDGLVELGVLTPQGAEILHGTRLLGNQAAHEAEAQPETLLRAAIAVAEYLLQGVYLLPQQAKDLPKRSKGARAAQAVSTAAAESDAAPSHETAQAAPSNSPVSSAGKPR